MPFVVNGAAFTGPVLITNETYDAATPFSGALAARALFPTASLIEGKRGTNHAASLSGVSCVDDAVAALLKNGKLPSRKAGAGPDKKCPGVAAPRLDDDPKGRVRAGAASHPGAAAAVYRRDGVRRRSVRSQIVCGEERSLSSAASPIVSVASVTT